MKTQPDFVMRNYETVRITEINPLLSKFWACMHFQGNDSNVYISYLEHT